MSTRKKGILKHELQDFQKQERSNSSSTNWTFKSYGISGTNALDLSLFSVQNKGLDGRQTEPSLYLGVGRK